MYGFAATRCYHQHTSRGILLHVEMAIWKFYSVEMLFANPLPCVELAVVETLLQ